MTEPVLATSTVVPPEVVATPPTTTVTDPDNIFADPRVTAALEKARQQEKDKLYGKLAKQDDAFEAMQAEIAKLRADREAREATELARQAELTAQLEAKRVDELSAKELLAEQAKTFQAQFAQLQAEREQERTFMAKEQEYQQLQGYIRDRVAAEVATDTIAPELADLVRGNNREEVEASIELIKAKTEAIAEGIRNAQIGARQQQRGVGPTGYSTTGPMDMTASSQTVTNEELANMSMDKFEEFRKRYGMPGRDTWRSGGLFG